jgi:nitrilase
MVDFPVVKVAAIQATPVILDADATIDKAVALVTDAADRGATLAVFPECFVSLYPSGVWASAAARFGGFDELWKRMWESSVDLHGGRLDPLLDVCRERGVHVVLGVNEREDTRPGSLYNTLVYLGPSGIVHRHRKLMPTMHERLFHGVGAGDDLAVQELPGVGRVGGLICWENRMPLARWRVYEGGPQIWVAPTADDADGWMASMRHVAIESGCFVVSVPQYIPRSAFPDDFPAAIPERFDVLGRGGVAVVDPLGDVIAGPVYDQEEMLVVECDLARQLRAKRWFDAAGHYSRADVLLPHLDAG